MPSYSRDPDLENLRKPKENGLRRMDKESPTLFWRCLASIVGGEALIIPLKRGLLAT